jgi:hypothetical protein
MDIRSQIIGLLDYTERMASLSERAVFRLADYRALVFHEQELRNRSGIHHDLMRARSARGSALRDPLWLQGTAEHPRSHGRQQDLVRLWAALHIPSDWKPTGW